MEEQAYREFVKGLMNPKLSFNEKLGNCASGLCGESAEVDAVIGDAEFMEDINRLKLADELGNCRWYGTALCLTMGRDSIVFYEGAITYQATPASQLTRLLMRNAGKVNDVVKKIIYHGHNFEDEESKLWNALVQYVHTYRALLQKFHDKDRDIKQVNYNKLSGRYKDLKFTTEQSVHRNNELITYANEDFLNSIR